MDDSLQVSNLISSLIIVFVWSMQVLQWMEDAGICPTLYMYQSVLPYIWRDNSMDYVTLMQEKISMTLSNLIIVCLKSMLLFFKYFYIFVCIHYCPC